MKASYAEVFSLPSWSSESTPEDVGWSSSCCRIVPDEYSVQCVGAPFKVMLAGRKGSL